MAIDQSSTAIVLRRSDSGESDRRLVLLTEDFGKIDVIAKGARKGGSRLAGSSEPLVLARFGWAEGKVRRFVTQVEPMTSFPKLRADFDRMMVGLAIAEVVAQSLEYESAVPEIYELVLVALNSLVENENVLAVMVWALARLLVEEGQSPDWTVCIVSDAPMTLTPAAVSAHAGGHIANEFAEQYDDTKWVRAETLIALNKISVLDAPPARLKGADECVRVLVSFWKGILNRRLNACDTAIREVVNGHE